MQGQGRSYTPGQFYEGEFKMNKKSGIGLQIFESWDTYDGSFEEETGTGEGIFTGVLGQKWLVTS